jgi:hypothetical protein
VEGKQHNFLEDAAILKIVETEGVNYAEAARRLKAREAATVPRKSERPAHWRSDDSDIAEF